VLWPHLFCQFKDVLEKYKNKLTKLDTCLQIPLKGLAKQVLLQASKHKTGNINRMTGTLGGIVKVVSVYVYITRTNMLEYFGGTQTNIRCRMNK
jgi:hypothetical protein